MIECRVCNTAEARVSWASLSVDLDGILERTALGDRFGRDSRTGNKIERQKTSWNVSLDQEYCLPLRSRKTQRKFAIASIAKNLLHRCICAHARVHMQFLRRVYLHFDRCCEHHACAGVYVRQVLWTSAYTSAYTIATGCAYALMYVQFIHWELGNEDGGVQLVYESTCCLAWGVIFDRRKNRGVVCVFSVFNAGGSVCGCMRVYTHTHTQTVQMGYSIVCPGVGIRHLEGPENPDGLNFGIYVFVFVYKVHMCMYMLGGKMRSWTNCFFLSTYLFFWEK